MYALQNILILKMDYLVRKKRGVVSLNSTLNHLVLKKKNKQKQKPPGPAVISLMHHFYFEK